MLKIKDHHYHQVDDTDEVRGSGAVRGSGYGIRDGPGSSVYNSLSPFRQSPRQDGRTPLHVACNIAVAAILLEHGAETDSRDARGNTPLQYVARMTNAKSGGSVRENRRSFSLITPSPSLSPTTQSSHCTSQSLPS